jgi:hypothetical protein
LANLFLKLKLPWDYESRAVSLIRALLDLATQYGGLTFLWLGITIPYSSVCINFLAWSFTAKTLALISNKHAFVCVSVCKVSACYTKLDDSPLTHGGRPTERQGPSGKLGSHFFVHFNFKRPSSNLPCHKSRVKAISDTFSSLSSSCASPEFSPDCGMFRNV